MARLLSLLLGAALALGLLLLPAARGRELTASEHGWMTLVLIAVCALFVHGSGFRFRARWLQAVFSPWLLWPAAALATGLFWRAAAG
ncbi:cyd operon YbgE family protein [Thermomonas flagellata]|uniref:cyd operon YbgE family protein n=1 Tax=Thermomonas flagellata TaxID=2888524 RepID=UPI001F04E546|nr:cyd operon YbgE family protein [Thermomonas flagellata]